MGVTSLVCLLLLLVIALTNGKKQPHILYIVMDDVGWTDVSYHGAEYSTPVVDELARTGVDLTQFYTQPVCSPTRSSIMTGRYPFRTGLQHWTTILPGSLAGIPPEDPTIAELLRDSGYHTAMIGKWHLGSGNWSQLPTRRGFNSFTGYLQAETDYYSKQFGGYDFWQNETVFWGANGTYSYDQYDAAFKDVMRSYVASKTTKPLFLYYSHQLAHVPLQLPDNSVYLERCANITNDWRRTYCAMMKRMDDSIGQTIQAFKDAGLWDDTILVCLSDNGGMVAYDIEWPASGGVNFPLRAGKTTLFEGGVRGISFLNGGRNVLPYYVRGTKNSDLWHVTDWGSTVLSIAGVPVPPKIQRDSFNMWPALMKQKPGQRDEIPLNIRPGGVVGTAIRVGDWKLISRPRDISFYDGWFPIPGRGSYEPAPDHSGDEYLFNIAKDPYERQDLSHDPIYEPLLKMLRGRIQSYLDKDFRPAQPNYQVCDPVNGAWVPCGP
eukprot:NODE_1272_length_1609_cov_42.675000_g1137_i0.p1 GENE.NODE_1272_length_1609_cov_42.675000_g1137_i0~~NODE_1272_length_1609_cov_42.675000_g1137_i0.p1  ORF type:complete len:508 (-),score=103.24 NODE_1272_length_1609_cov_42.675000_g1137_i0:84-1559(-)